MTEEHQALLAPVVIRKHRSSHRIVDHLQRSSPSDPMVRADWVNSIRTP